MYSQHCELGEPMIRLIRRSGFKSAFASESCLLCLFSCPLTEFHRYPFTAFRII